MSVRQRGKNSLSRWRALIKTMNARNRRRGFTLAEMIAAIALLAVFSVIVVQLFAAAHTLTTRTDRLDSAVLCARNLAEGWQAGLDQPEYSALADNPFTAGPLQPAQILRLNYTGDLQAVEPGSARIEIKAELKLADQQETGTEALQINILSLEGDLVFKLTAARLAPEVTAP
jgi:prepilin-type N-terminal cleavage/methylation domain-containing protein